MPYIGINIRFKSRISFIPDGYHIVIDNYGNIVRDSLNRIVIAKI
jgi:hypothetical protein